MEECLKKLPSEKALMEDLELIQKIIEEQAQGNKVTIENGEVFAWKVDEYGRKQEVPLGTMRDVSQVAREMYGDTLPKELEFIPLGGVTMLTLNGSLAAVGRDSRLESSPGYEALDTSNEILHNPALGFLGFVCDTVTQKPIYQGIVVATGVLGVALQSKERRSITDYDGITEMLADTVGLVDPINAVGGYAEMASLCTLKSMIDTMRVDLEVYNNVVLETAKYKDRDFLIKWEEDVEVTQVTPINPDDFKAYEIFGANVICNVSRQVLQEAGALLPDEQTEVTVNAAEVRRASKLIHVDPLIIDLNQNHLYTTTLEDGAYYDYGKDGMKEKTAWADPGDAFLACDRNGDGAITPDELFGDKTLLPDGTYADNGFTALAQHDTNGDGLIDGWDEIFAGLTLWQDTNGNGTTEEGELKSLDELGIASIGLAHSVENRTDENGNIIFGEASVTLTDGTILDMGALDFETDSMDTRLENEIVVSDAIRLMMPDLKGTGNVMSLHQAMETNPKLLELVTDYIFVGTAAEKDILSERILVEWSGCGEVKAGLRGGMDAVQLAVIEAFYGKEYTGVNGSNPNTTASGVLKGVYQKLLLDMKDGLLQQTYGAFCTLLAPIRQNEETGELSCDIRPLCGEINRLYQDTQLVYDILSAYTRHALENGVAYETLNTKEINDKIGEIGFGDIDTLLGNTIIHAGDTKLINGTRMSDTIYAHPQGTAMFGGEGNDRLYGAGGDDTLWGGEGDDYLQGGGGVNTYIYHRGDGNDIIFNADGNESRLDTCLQFGEGIHAEEIAVSRERKNLILTDTVTGQRITVQDAYASQVYYLENIVFADGTAWSLEDVKEKIALMQGTDASETLEGHNAAYGCTGDETIHAGAGDDRLYGNGGNDRLHGEEGNDILYGGEGEDTLYGGEGNDQLYGDNGDDQLQGGAGDDYLHGGSGADTYLYHRGDGNDTIYNVDGTAGRLNDKLRFGEGILPEEIAASRERKNLILTDTVTGQRITVQDAYANQVYYLENIVFADGTAWSLEDVKEKIALMQGTEGNDTLEGHNAAYGCTGDETIHAGAGNDRLYGNGGNDLLHGEEGNDILYGGEGEDTLYGGEGNDQLYGDNGDDQLQGGAGDDYLHGGSGTDTYLYHRGDGNDTIYNVDGTAGRLNDKLRFGEGILPEEIAASRERKNLILTDTVTGQRITVQDAYANQVYYLENIVFADGTAWSLEDVKERIALMQGTEGNDNLDGHNAAYGCTGDETIHAGAGDDRLYGNGGNDLLYGEEGNDILYGGEGEDTLYGGEGNDQLYGDNGDDQLQGGAGDDYLHGGSGADTYLYHRGDGNDTIYNVDGTAGRLNDKLRFGEGILPEEITASRERKNLILTDTVTGQRITVQDAYANQVYYLENIVFADGTAWSLEDVKEKIALMQGTEGNDNLEGHNAAYGCTGDETIHAGAGDDRLYGNGGNDRLHGEEGNDILYGGEGEDTLYGGEGNDQLYGDTGDDQLCGGAGDDHLYGGNGADTYLYSRGDGNDTLFNTDNDGGIDTLLMGMEFSDLTLSREGNHLLVSDMEGEGSVRIQDWYLGGQYRLDAIRTEDDRYLAGEQVDLLIQAMASFETDSGMGFQEALRLQDEQAMGIAEQFWIQQKA